MNSEIPNLLKLSPISVAKPSHQALAPQSPGVNEDGGGLVVSFVSSPQAGKSVSAVNQNEKSEQETSPELVKEAVDQGNSLLQMAKRNLQFKVDEETNEQVVKIVDSDSGEVVRQIPTEEMLAFIRRMQELEGLQGSVLQDRA